MSANNWTTCPKCEVKRKALIEKRKSEMIAAYGQVDACTYERIRNNLLELEADPLEQTLREDYALGIHDGQFRIGYSATCERCAFKFHYKAEQAAFPNINQGPAPGPSSGSSK